MSPDPITYGVYNDGLVFGEIEVDVGWGKITHRCIASGPDGPKARALIASGLQDWAEYSRSRWKAEAEWRERSRRHAK